MVVFNTVGILVGADQVFATPYHYWNNELGQNMIRATTFAYIHPTGRMNCGWNSGWNGPGVCYS